MTEPTKTDSPFTLFDTSAKHEQEGVRIDYGSFWFQVSRAGGKNRKYVLSLQRTLKPHRRAIQTETISQDKAEELAITVFVEGCLINWGSTTYGDGKMVGRNGEVIAFSQAAAIDLLRQLPDLFADLKGQAETLSNFRDDTLEEDAKN